MIRYRLDDLGWYQFEWLCQSLLKAEFGVGIESWGGHSDLGRDAYYDGDLPIPEKGIKNPGPFLFQAKFVAEANAAGAKPGNSLKRAVSSECKAIKKRFIKRGISKVKHYVLITNVPLTMTLRNEIQISINNIIPECSFTIWGGSDLCDFLDNVPNIRVAFPQIMGLRDLTELLSFVVEKPIRERSTLSIDRAAELAQVFVPTEAYSKALQTLAKHSFVVLTGPPEMGKTTIARIIGLARLGENWDCFECRQPNDFLQMIEKDRPQLFIADDAFGSTEYRPDIAQAWASDMDGIIGKLDNKHWLVWTSRPAPLKIALQRMHLQGKAEKFPEPAEILVDASELKPEEKALILYRHAKAKGLMIEAKKVIKINARSIIHNKHFTPERVRRFLNDRLYHIIEDSKATSKENFIEEAITLEINEPTVGMRKSFEALDSDHQIFLISMLDAAAGPVIKENACNTFKRLIGTNHGCNIERIVDVLTGHFIRRLEKIYIYTGPPGLDWMHPSWRDLLIDFLITNIPIRREFLRRCGAYGILLALSSYGGHEGTRQKPLLIEGEDWNELESNVIALLRANNIEDAFKILAAIHDSLKTEFDIIKNMNNYRHPLLVLANNSLNICRETWGKYNQILNNEILKLYFIISEFIIPLPPSPNLKHTWDYQWEEIKDEIDDNVGRSTSFIDQMEKMIELIDIIIENEPRFIRQVSFPENYINITQEAIFKIKNDLDYDVALVDEDDYDNEIEWHSNTLEIVDKIPYVFPELTDLSAKIEKLIQRKQSQIEDEKQQHDFEEEDDSYKHTSRHPSGGFDIDELFKDL